MGEDDGNVRSPIPHRPHAVIADDADAPPRGETRQTAAQPGSEVGHAGVDGIHVHARSDLGHGNVPREDDGHDETVDADDPRHDHRDDVLHHRSGMADAGVK